MKLLGKYSIGLGDRFGHQGGAQLKAIMAASAKGIEITPVWNKSNREHTTIGTQPGNVRIEADSVTKSAGFKKTYFVDADHINFDTVDRFIESSDFFTIDVASYIGKKAEDQEIIEFLASVEKYTGDLKIPGTRLSYKTSKPQITQIAEKYLFAAIKAWNIFRKIEKAKGRGNFITEVSMDEVPYPQTPVELFFILKMLASGKYDKGIHLKTAGTTWLEEVIGLAESGGEALAFVKEIYIKSLEKIDELCAPYADVIDINFSSLPSKTEVSKWNSIKFADSLRHVTGNIDYNPNMRQLIHVAYKLAALKMDDYFGLLEVNEKTVSQCVYENIYNRHICRLFNIT
ncbi:MAG: tagaturonate epimerase family protein [Bacteroidia bacterium]|nr:tagaturonate epimerase family protein [Bacteroidia bacterium]